eukprot:TRINITY_DN69276_c0_g1_i1.p1 TRINITY_DN69276_c0_g1~~TRINITY_DN69276_c0_g1_i1.p1  ORF type:complete len:220 (+),score=47.53 TRINITY_DN69276_c0_g1_i1:48-662(+)
MSAARLDVLFVVMVIASTPAGLALKRSHATSHAESLSLAATVARNRHSQTATEMIAEIASKSTTGLNLTGESIRNTDSKRTAQSGMDTFLANKTKMPAHASFLSSLAMAAARANQGRSELFLAATHSVSGAAAATQGAKVAAKLRARRLQTSVAWLLAPCGMFLGMAAMILLAILNTHNGSDLWTSSSGCRSNEKQTDSIQKLN